MSFKNEDFESPFAKIYLAVQQYLETQMPELKQIALDLGQLDYYETRPALAFPCLLIDFPSANYSELGQLVQWGNLIMQTRLAFAPFSRIDSITPDISVEAALQFYELEAKLYRLLNGYTPSLLNNDDKPVQLCQPLTRLDAKKEMREDPFIVRVNNWSTAGEDFSAMIPVNKASAKLQLE